MPISGGKYVAPTWHNNAAPALDETELQAMSDTIEANQDSYEVGDIYFTTRTDLGDDWLLCNGDVISPEEYPELAAMLPGGVNPMALIKSGLVANARSLMYNGEYYGFVDDGVRFYTSPTLDGNYTDRGLTPGDNVPNVLNGDPNHYWFCYTDDDREFAYGTGDLSSGWTYNSPVDSTANDNGYMDFYGQGYYVARCQLYSYDLNFYATSPGASEPGWTEIPEPYRIVGFANGYWFGTTRDGNDYNQLLYSEDITQPIAQWGNVNIPVDVGGYDIFYLNGKYIIACRNNGLYFSDSPSSLFNKVTMPANANSGSMEKYECTVHYGNGVYVVYFQNNNVFATKEIETNPTWVELTSQQLFGDTSTPVTELMYFENQWVMLTNQSIYAVDVLMGATLPNISIDGVYAYIRGRKGAA